MILTKWGGVMTAQQCVSGGPKSPIYNLLHLCNYQDHQQWEKILIPGLCWSPFKTVTCLSQGRSLRFKGIHLWTLRVRGHPLVSYVILNSICFLSPVATSCEPGSFSLHSDTCPALRESGSQPLGPHVLLQCGCSVHTFTLTVAQPTGCFFACLGENQIPECPQSLQGILQPLVFRQMSKHGEILK